MKTAAVLLRASTNKQELDSQKNDVKNVAEKMGYHIPDEFYFGEKISGDRPQYIDELDAQGQKTGYLINMPDSKSIQDLKKACQDPETRDKINVIFVWEISRLSRKQSLLFSHIEFFNKLKKPIYFTSHQLWTLDENTKEKNEQGQSIITSLSYYIEHEHQRIKERTTRGKRHAFQYDKDRYLGGKIPFGFKIELRDNHKYLVQDEKELEIINDIFDKYINHLWSFKKISDYLNNSNIKGKQGGRWNKTTVGQIFNNKRLIGERIFSDMKTDSTPIIDENIYERGQKILEDKRLIYGKKKRKYNYPLKGLIKCGDCGKILQGRVSKISKQYYCSHCNINKFRADAIVWDAIKSYGVYHNHLMHELINKNENENEKLISENEKQIDINKKGIETANKQRKRFLSLVHDDACDMDYIKDNMKEVNTRIKELEKENRRLQNENIEYTKEKKISPEDLAEIHNYIENKTNDIESITKVFKTLIKEIKVYNYGQYWTIMQIVLKDKNTMIAINDRANKKNEYMFSIFPFFEKCQYDKTTQTFTIVDVEDEKYTIQKLIDDLKDIYKYHYTFIEQDPYSYKTNENVRLMTEKRKERKRMKKINAKK